MEFVKKNWAKLVFALVAIVGIVFSVLDLVAGPVKDLSLGEYTNGVYYSSLFISIAQLLFFSGILIYIVLKMINVTNGISKYVLLGISVVTLVFVILSFTNAADYLSYAKEQIDTALAGAALLPESVVNGLNVSKYALVNGTYTKIVQLLIFAVLPMVYSAKKLFKKN